MASPLPTIFAPAVHDQSLVYLYGIFGTLNDVIPAPGAAKITMTQLTLLGTLFSKFNTIMLAVGVLIVVYTTIVGILNTAHEGQFMGKNWNNLWIPIRTVMGIAALIPTGSGYSGIQIIMMWVIVQGIGAADTLWTAAIGFYAQNGSMYAKVGVPTLEMKDSIRGLFQGLVCAQSAAATYANPIPGNDDIKYFCTKNSSDSFCRSASNPETFAPSLNTPGVTEYSLGPDGACGTLNYCDVEKACAAGNENSLLCKTCTIQIDVLRKSIPMLSLLAYTYVDMDHEYLDYWAKASAFLKMQKTLKLPPGSLPKPKNVDFITAYCTADNNPACLDVPSPIGDDMSAPGSVIKKIYWDYGLKPKLGSSSDFVNVFVGNYSKAMADVIKEYMDQLRNNSKTTMSDELQTAVDAGWIVAGSYYFVISQGNAKNITAMMPNISFTVDTNKLPSGKRPLNGYRNNYQAGSTLVCLAQGGSNCSSASSGALNGAANGGADAANVYQQALEATDTDPIAQIMATGNMYLNIAEAIFWIFFALMLVLAVLAMLASLEILGNGIPVGLMPVLFEITALFTPIVMALITFLLGVGATYAIYVPLIPFMIFTLGAIGWMISTVEAMVAGPIVALGIMSPSGHHEVLGKAEPALGLLFSIFLRPSLMIFGMFAAMLLSAQVMKMGNAGFAIISSTTSLSGPGMFKAIIVMMANVSFNVALLNKTFSAIYVIPERVLSWISIQVPHEGAQELGELKAGVDKGASEAGAIGKGLQSGTNASGAIRAAKDKKKQQGAGLKGK